MDSNDAIAALGALAQTTRLETFRLLVKHEPAGVPVGELARAIGVPQNTMSTHLRVLANAGVIFGERQSRSIVYRADMPKVQELTMFLIQDCCGGGAEFCGPLLACLAPAKPVRARSRKDKIG
jgi:DNA-binding transcriptional ArsR family regulator